MSYNKNPVSTPHSKLCFKNGYLSIIILQKHGFKQQSKQLISTKILFRFTKLYNMDIILYCNIMISNLLQIRSIIKTLSSIKNFAFLL